MYLAYGIVFGYSYKGQCRTNITFINDRFYVEYFEDAEYWRVIEKQSNKHPGTLSFHDGNTDSECKFHGKHWHWFVETSNHPTSDSRWGRNLVAYSKQHTDLFFACCRAKIPGRLLQHIKKPPRIVIGSNIEDGKYTSTSSMEEEDKENTDPATKRRKKTTLDITVLENMMIKYQTAEISQLRDRASREDRETLREARYNLNFDRLFSKATDLFMTECKRWTMYEIIRPLEWIDPIDYEFEVESLQYFDEILRHNAIDKEQFVNDIWNVLNCTLIKKNAFFLQGPPNSGKSLILRSLIPYFPNHSEIRGNSSYNFLFQDCINSRVILYEEPTIDTSIVNQIKLIFEGADTHVNIKMKSSQLLTRTPVIGSTNRDLWKWCSVDQDAIRARTFIYRMKEAPFLKDLYKPRIF